MRIAAVGLVLLSTAGAVGAASPSPTCGRPGKPPCPLQAFMRDAIARPYATRNFEALGSSLEQLRGLNPNPDMWRDWGVFAAEAAQAARGQDEDATLRACSRCHRSYRREYLESFRERRLRVP